MFEALPPVTTAAAWRGDRLVRSDEWIYRLSDAQVLELETLGTRFVEANPDLRTVRRGGLSAQRLRGVPSTAWGHDVDYGRGFVLVRGLRTRRYSDASVGGASTTSSGCTWVTPSARTRWATSSITSYATSDKTMARSDRAVFQGAR